MTALQSDTQLNESYHNLYVTTATIKRSSLFDLPYGIEVTCLRTTGWRLWNSGVLLAGEFDGPAEWLVLDVSGHVIVDSRAPAAQESAGQ